jgi:hypothetical protein
MVIQHNCYTMHNSTHTVHKRLLKVWRARLLRLWPSCYVSSPPRSEADCQPFPPPGTPGPPASRMAPFPRIHKHPLPTVRYKYIFLYFTALRRFYESELFLYCTVLCRFCESECLPLQYCILWVSISFRTVL